MPAKIGRKYVCTWSCGRSNNMGQKHADTTLFTRGQIYICDMEGCLKSNNGEEIHLSENSFKKFFKQYRAPRQTEVNESMLFPEDDEMTRYDFISNMEHFMKQLMKDPLRAHCSNFLKKHNIDEPKAVQILTMRTNPEDPESAVMIKKTRIINGDVDENGNKGKDQFGVKYSVPRKDYNKKMRNLYISLFENYRCDNPLLNEDGEGGGDMGGGATTTFSVSPSNGITVPLSFKKKGKDEHIISRPIAHVNEGKRKIYVTEEQLYAIEEATTTFGMTPQGNAMGDITPPGCFGDSDTMNHKDMMKRSWEGK